MGEIYDVDDAAAANLQRTNLVYHLTWNWFTGNWMIDSEMHILWALTVKLSLNIKTHMSNI